MSTTVINKARVWSKKIASGEIVYLFEEQRYCIKDGPECAEWCAMKFGRKADIVEHIYGMLYGIAGHALIVGGKSPIKVAIDMLRLLENPMKMPHERAVFKNTGGYSAISDDNRKRVVESLTHMGRTDLAEKVSRSEEHGGEASISLDLETESEVVMELTNKMRYEDLDGNRRWTGIPVCYVFPSFAISHAEKGPSEPVVEPTDPAKPEVWIYESAINFCTSLSLEPKLIHVLTVDGTFAYAGENNYWLEVEILKLIKDRHLEASVCLVNKWLTVLRSAKKKIEKLPMDCTFKFQLKSDETWRMKPFFAVAKAIKGDAVGDFFEATNEQLSSVVDQVRGEMSRLFSDEHGIGYSLEVDAFEPVGKSLF